MATVQLAVYDLSQGMAAQFSMAFIGSHVEGIWHTGVVIFGYEYFFGGGVQKMRYGAFARSHGMQPRQLLDMGSTLKTEPDVDTFIGTIRHRFTQATYNLISHNCNNFSNELTIFLLNKEIPHNILYLARDVFSTPGGARLRPLIEGMTNNVNNTNNHGLDPFGNSNPYPVADTNIYNTYNTPNNNTFAPTPSVKPVITVNPDALASYSKHISIPIVFNSYLTSKGGDANTISMLHQKIMKHAEIQLLLQEYEKDIINNAVKYIIDKQNTISSADTATTTNNNKNNNNVSEVYRILYVIISQVPSLQLSALFILRLVILYIPLENTVNNDSTGNNNPSWDPNILWEWLLNATKGYCKLLNNSNTNISESKSFHTLSAFVMNLCVFNNILCKYCNSSNNTNHTNIYNWFITHQSELVDVMINVLQLTTSSTVNMKQLNELQDISTSYLYNMVYYYSNQGTIGAGFKDRYCTHHNNNTAGGAADDDDDINNLHPYITELICSLLEQDMDHPAGGLSVIVRVRKWSVICMILRCLTITSTASDSTSTSDTNHESSIAIQQIFQLMNDLDYTNKVITYRDTLKSHYIHTYKPTQHTLDSNVVHEMQLIEEISKILTMKT